VSIIDHGWTHISKLKRDQLELAYIAAVETRDQALARVATLTAEASNFETLATQHYHEARELRGQLRAALADRDGIHPNHDGQWRHDGCSGYVIFDADRWRCGECDGSGALSGETPQDQNAHIRHEAGADATVEEE